MKRRFFAAVDGLDKNAEKAVIEFLNENGMGWWHHIPNFWLLTDPRETMTAKKLRDEINKHRSKPSDGCLVMQIHEDIDWAASLPKKGEDKDAFGWIGKTWED